MPKRNRFVSPDVKRLDLSDDDWVEVRARLSYREAQELSGAMLRSVKGTAGDQEVGVDFGRYAVLKLVTYIQDWSFRDEQDRPVTLSPAAIENLDPDTAEEINNALDKYLAEYQASKVTPATNGSGKK